MNNSEKGVCSKKILKLCNIVIKEQFNIQKIPFKKIVSKKKVISEEISKSDGYRNVITLRKYEW